MTHTMELKIQMIDEYISKAKEIESNNDKNAAKRYVDTVLGIFSAEIPGLKNNLDRFNYKFGDENTDHLFDVLLLREKLQNHKLNLQSGLYSNLNP